MANPSPASTFVPKHSEIELAMADPSPASSLLPKHTGIELASESQASPPYCHQANDFEASTSTSTAADPNKNSSSNYQFDIFINHRGPEMKKTFASHLYHRLLSCGVRAFLDYKEMQEGENITSQIKAAIANASAHVAIFSPRYAESHWCLDELLLMLDSKAPIIPVFHNVRPADLRWTEGKDDGEYSCALQKLKEKKTLDRETQEEKPRYHSSKIESWRKTLSIVSEISGFELEACRDEVELLDKLVERLLKMVKKPVLKVAKYPVGLEEKVKDFENTVLFQQPASGKHKVVGIVGSGGVGKTTLAKELFNRKSSYFSQSYFLSDVRGNAANGSLTQLVEGLSTRMLDAGILNAGILHINNRNAFYPCFIVLDDVDYVDQLDALLPDRFKDSLSSNCLILITSRDKSVLLRSGLKYPSIYNLTGLDTQHSRELFCYHAFRQPYPQPGFHDLVDKFLTQCSGLPLSLKVIGALFLENSDKSYWEEQFNKLNRGIPDDIVRSLTISYDSLDEEDKRIFLDIACFLIGEKRDTSIKLWDTGSLGYRFSGISKLWDTSSLGFQNLQNKCLVEIDSENCIQMHDHLRDLGRQIAEKSGVRVPCLWDQTDNTNIANLSMTLQQSSSKKLRGIRIIPTADVRDDGFKSYRSLRSEMPWFKRRIEEMLGKPWMKLGNRLHAIPYPGITRLNLQLLVTEDHLLEHILRTAHLPSLRLLRWYKCGHSSLPSWIPKEDLRVLHVVGSTLKILWQGKEQAPLRLRVLQIWAPLSKIPKSIGKLQHLEQIYITLAHDSDLKSLPEEFCQLLSLKRLELLNASKMESLPDLIGDLTNLEHLDLSSSGLKRLPNSFQNLARLKYLDLRYTYFRNISKSVTLQLPWSLQELHVSKLPSNIENLTNLEVLGLFHITPLEMLPPSLSALRNLKELALRGCHRLKRLPDSLGQLTKLEVNDCHSLVEYGTLPNTLVKLRLTRCYRLKKIDGLCGLAKLQMLYITDAEVEELAGIEALVSLEELRVSRCRNMKRIPGLGQLTKLRLLDVSGCSEIEELEGVEQLRSLEKLDASQCSKLQWDGVVLEKLPQRLKEGMLII